MQVIGDILNFLFMEPIINLIVFILRILESLSVPGALGFSIIILTLIISLVTWPFRAKQIKHAKSTAETMALIKPKIKALKEKHKNDKMAFNQAQAALLKEHGINPAAGCLPTLIPILIIWPLYQVIFAFFGGQEGLDKINYFLYSSDWHLTSLPSSNFFGINLAQHPSDFAKVGFLILLIPLITALLTFIQSKMMMPKAVKEYPSDSPKEKKEKESTEEALQAMQGQMIFLMPIMIAVFAFNFPIGLALYWNVLTLIGIVQQYLISGWGGMEGMVKSFPFSNK